MASISIQGITKRFGDVTAVDAMDVTIADGEFFGLLGPNGAGKTTTLRLIAGLDTPDSGSLLMKLTCPVTGPGSCGPVISAGIPVRSRAACSVGT